MHTLDDNLDVVPRKDIVCYNTVLKVFIKKMMMSFEFFPDLCEEVQGYVASFLDLRDGTHLMMTSHDLHRLVSMSPICWQGWKPIKTQIEWQGAIDPQYFSQSYVKKRQELANAAAISDWETVRKILSEYPEWVNFSRFWERNGFSPLHEAARQGNPPLALVRYMVYGCGAWRTLKTTNGKRAIDLAQEHTNSHPALVAMLMPPNSHDMERRDERVEEILQDRLQVLIQSRSRANKIDCSNNFRIPQVTVLSETSKLFCILPGGYSSFSLKLVTEENGCYPKIVADSWCRLVGRSGQRHEITAEECKLVHSGFI
jgi:hypothetical protein